MKKNVFAVVLGILIVALGAFGVLAPSLFVDLKDSEKDICLYIGLACLVLGTVIVLVGGIKIFLGKGKNGKQKKRQKNQEFEHIESFEISSGNSSSSVRYIPSENVYHFVSMGDHQSTEEKFNEIAKMDRTQFVIYVAKLFSRKGYQVKYTPVVDNYNIDLLVEKMGVTIAVGCILTTKVLSDKDIRCIVEGSKYYQVNNIMALTNMYFDRSALELAKRERMSLVDRNILAEDFMK